MRDIQNELDNREIPLQKVGVRGVKYPIAVLDKKNKTQNSTASVDLFVNLPHNFKGTHMSRFIEIFHKYHKNINMQHFLLMLEEIREKLEAEKAFGCIQFPYYIEKEAPVSKTNGYVEYLCSYQGEVYKNKENPASAESKFYVCIEIPVTTLCPCSKAISEYGAHNQRGTVRVKLLYSDFFWIEDVISTVEQAASSPIYSALKRQDEKYVTEHAYENPRFVEDVVREVYLGLKKMNFKWFSVEAENEESIHLHNAYAYTEYSE
ncbi:MAG: GTP cyclohydrolase FolE2 [Treponema sp.]|nr:GTP cyclohydrolase FolE2 [Treponema sp.]